MRFRVHLFVEVRVEHELEADTPEEAARQTFEADLNLYRRLAAPGLEITGPPDEVCLVDPLTEETDQDGRLLPDQEWSQFLRVTQKRQPDGSWCRIVTPALESPALNLVS